MDVFRNFDGGKTAEKVVLNKMSYEIKCFVQYDLLPRFFASTIRISVENV